MQEKKDNIVEKLWQSWLGVCYRANDQGIPACVSDILRQAFLAGYQAHMTAEEVVRRDLPEDRARQVLAEMAEDFHRYCDELKLGAPKESN